MRSLLFVPGDTSEKFEKAFRAGADALILDLEDSVAPAAKDAARRSVLAFLKERRNAVGRPRLFVRINGLASPLSEGDLDVVMTGAPDGIVLPKAAGGADVALLDARLAVREALHGIEDRSTRVIALVTETAASLFALGSYRGASDRLLALTWGMEDLGAELGAAETRTGGEITEPMRTVRSLALFAATAAGVPALDTVYTDFRNIEGLRRECSAARRDGFAGKLAIHPDQVEIINEAFTPSSEAIAHAEAVAAAFKAAGETAGVVALDGKMLDLPHLAAARRLLAQAAALRKPLTAETGLAAEADSSASEAPISPEQPPSA